MRRSAGPGSRSIWNIRHGHVQAHRQARRGLYIGAWVLAGVFTLLPGRSLGSLLWKQALGVIS